MPITVLAFGQVADILGSPSLEMDGASDTDSLLVLLHQRYPGLKDLHFALAVDRKTVDQNTTLKPVSVVALLPPFSGG